jgi:hypothetical protein
VPKEDRRSYRQFTWSVGRLPIPGQQLIKPVDGVIVDTTEQVGEPCLQIDICCKVTFSRGRNEAAGQAAK